MTKIEEVARALWNEIREDEDRSDMELEDMGRNHRVWDYARAAIRAMGQPPADEGRIETLYQDLTETEGTIKLQRWPEGLVLWVGGEIRWKSWGKSGA